MNAHFGTELTQRPIIQSRLLRRLVSAGTQFRPWEQMNTESNNVGDLIFSRQRNAAGHVLKELGQKYDLECAERRGCFVTEGHFETLPDRSASLSPQLNGRGQVLAIPLSHGETHE